MIWFSIKFENLASFNAFFHLVLFLIFKFYIYINTYKYKNKLYYYLIITVTIKKMYFVNRRFIIMKILFVNSNWLMIKIILHKIKQKKIYVQYLFWLFFFQNCWSFSSCLKLQLKFCRISLNSLYTEKKKNSKCNDFVLINM